MVTLEMQMTETSTVHPDAATLDSLCEAALRTDAIKALSTFNPFRVLKVDRYELRHTNTLSWLLDPEGTHSLGAAFLHAFLDSVKDAASSTFRDAVSNSLQGGQAADCPVDVTPELVFATRSQTRQQPIGSAIEGNEGRDRIDILVESRSESTWVMAVEAKIDSREGLRQLANYDARLADLFPSEVPILKLYLTVDPMTDSDEDKISSTQWVNIHWGDRVAKALEVALGRSIHLNYAENAPLKTFLLQYQAMLQGFGTRSNRAEHRELFSLVNGKEFRPTLSALKESRPAIWRANLQVWERAYWRQRKVLDHCVATLVSPSAEFVWRCVDRLLDGSWDILTRRGSDTGVVEFVPRLWASSPLLKATNIVYRAEFRPQYSDVEIKLYLPSSGKREEQWQLLEALYGTHDTPVWKLSQPLREAFQLPHAETWSTLSRSAGALRRDVKIFSTRISWVKLEAGSHLERYELDDDRATSRVEEFSKHAEMHCTALTALSQ